MSKKKYNSVPGRGLLTKPAINDRKEHLLTLGYSVDHIEKTGISYTAIQNNIESLIGSVEIPTGLVGANSVLRIKWFRGGFLCGLNIGRCISCEYE